MACFLLSLRIRSVLVFILSRIIPILIVCAHLPAYAFTLTVTNPGNGSGNVNGAIMCDIAEQGECAEADLSGPVSLSAVPDWKSLFNGWAGVCSGTGQCSFTLDSDTVITAFFVPNPQAIIIGHTVFPEYSTLTSAYGAAKDQNSIAAHVYIFHEDLVLNQPKFVRFYFGRAAGFYYGNPTGFTTLQGSLVIQDGSALIDSLIIQ